MKVFFEDVRYRSNHSFICASNTADHLNCPYHWHPEYEITLVVSGRGHRVIGDHMRNFEPGDLVLLGPNLPHLYQGWRISNEHSHTLYIQFSPEKLPLFELPECRNISELLKRADRGLLFSAKRGVTIQSQMEAILETEGPKRLLLFVELLDTLANAKNAEPLASIGYQSSLNATKTERLKRVLDYIEDNYSSPIEMNEVAELACLHPQSFSRFFRREMRKTFQNYLIELRLSHATRKLLDSDKAITEVAFEAGFSNLSNFNRLFKKHFGETPSAYQKRVGVEDAIVRTEPIAEHFKPHK
ncbi:helix-turn-helix domain-containing protein [Pelagicoccus mobilis]|uniref:Helix-turn-helix domain-containing protein n=1 Tax=Pelagicoccus mobilis TaxID=415221 RepID=A0A934RVX3_9BACT|nr:AraC family transcriptional regulator [Pelagicoccus mobilis]MBK1878710.1 helix-turn-helix domain-containing protein [Pelagicoccus mobilis]